MFIAPKLKVGSLTALVQEMPADHTPSVPTLAEIGHDDGLVHNHGWANARQDSARTAPRQPCITVADAGSVRTPSSALHDDIHYA
jgi:hypothetical protein